MAGKKLTRLSRLLSGSGDTPELDVDPAIVFPTGSKMDPSWMGTRRLR